MSSGRYHRRSDIRIVISEFISLDGVVQAPGGAEEDTDGGFQHGGSSMPFFDPEVMGSSIDEASKRTDALLYGRRTWQVMAGAWPERAGDPFADWINAVEKHVVSNTLSEADLTWAPTSLIRGADLPAAVTALRERPGRDVNVMGSSLLARWLLGEDLVDEMYLMIEPIVLGGGKGIFPIDGAPVRARVRHHVGDGRAGLPVPAGPLDRLPPRSSRNGPIRCLRRRAQPTRGPLPKGAAGPARWLARPVAAAVTCAGDDAGANWTG